MLIGITGATGFLGRYVVNHLLAAGHHCRCWFRPGSDRGGFLDAPGRLEWTPGGLNDEASNVALAMGADAVVHAALDWPRGSSLAQPGQVHESVQHVVECNEIHTAFVFTQQIRIGLSLVTKWIKARGDNCCRSQTGRE